MSTAAYTATQARLLPFEQRYYRPIQTQLLRDVERAAVYYEAGAIPELAISVLKSAPMFALVGEMMRECATQEAAFSYESVSKMLAAEKAGKPKPVAPPSAAERINFFISTEGAKDVKNITESTRKQIKEALLEAQKQGLGRKEAAEMLRTRVGSLCPVRAGRIVRTELITAANYGSLSGAQALGVPLLKKWIATPGGRTRIDHQLANGETADLNGVFEDIGGESAEYPGDPNLSLGQRVNCRCSIGYQPLK